MVKANFSHFNSVSAVPPTSPFRWALITIIVNVISGNYDYFFFEKAGISRNPYNLKMSYFPFSDKNKLSCLPKNAIQQTTDYVVVLRSCLYVFLGLIYYKGAMSGFSDGQTLYLIRLLPPAPSLLPVCISIHTICAIKTHFLGKRERNTKIIYTTGLKVSRMRLTSGLLFSIVVWARSLICDTTKNRGKSLLSRIPQLASCSILLANKMARSRPSTTKTAKRCSPSRK